MTPDVQEQVELFQKMRGKTLAPATEAQSGVASNEVSKHDVSKSEGRQSVVPKSDVPTRVVTSSGKSDVHRCGVPRKVVCPNVKGSKVICKRCGKAVSPKYLPAHNWEQHSTWRSMSSP